MLQTLREILRENWEWRDKVARLAVFELRKQARGAVFGWAWIAIKPALYVFVFWFALEFGLRAGAANADASYPYFVWLVSGLIPWFFMADMISPGTDVLHRYTYLVNKVKFPISGISTLYTLSTLLVNAVLFIILMVIYFAYGMPLDIYLLQVPLLLVLMAVFWNMVSIFGSELSALSKDFSSLVKALKQPLFWLSGVIFNMSLIASSPIGWVADVMLFNPVTFFVTAFRKATCDKVWFWEDPVFFGCFVAMFVITLVLMLYTYKRQSKEVADVL